MDIIFLLKVTCLDYKEFWIPPITNILKIIIIFSIIALHHSNDYLHHYYYFHIIVIIIIIYLEMHIKNIFKGAIISL